MASNSDIEWADATWNFLKGCTPVSAGCLNCYAAGVAHQKQNHPNPKVSAQFAGLTVLKRAGEGQRAVFNGRINVVEHLIEAPLRWREPKRIFVNSLSDLFHPDVPYQLIDRAFAVMELCPQHTFQILTKRPERMADYLCQPRIQERIAPHSVRLRATHGSIPKGIQFLPWPLPNVWLGTSVEDQAASDERVPHLLLTPAAVRFLSCEPLLGPVDLTRIPVEGGVVDALRGAAPAYPPLGWVIVGGESGAHARPMHPDWARSLRDQCQAAGVPFFFKQWGEWTVANEANQHARINFVRETPAASNGSFEIVRRTGKHAAGRELDGRTWDEFPEVTRV